MYIMCVCLFSALSPCVCRRFTNFHYYYYYIVHKKLPHKTFYVRSSTHNKLTTNLNRKIGKETGLKKGSFSSGQGGLSLGWSFIRDVFHQGGLLLGWSFIRVVYHQGGLSSGWSFIRVVFHQGGLSLVWPFITVVFHQGGLLLGWSFIRVVFH